MTQTIEAIYTGKIIKPLKPIKGLKEDQRIEITIYIPPKKEGIKALANTMSREEAIAMGKMIEAEFEKVDNGW